MLKDLMAFDDVEDPPDGRAPNVYGDPRRNRWLVFVRIPRVGPMARVVVVSGERSWSQDVFVNERAQVEDVLLLL